MKVTPSQLRSRIKGHFPTLIHSGRALTVSLLYLLLGSLWILISDNLVFQMDQGPITIEENLSTVKGLLFVGTSAFGIFILTSLLYSRLVVQATELQAVFSKPNLGSLQFDSDGRIHSFTPCIAKLLDMPEEVLRRRNVKDLTHPKDWPQVEDLISEFTAGERDDALICYRLQTSDGNSRWVEKNIRVLDRTDNFCRFISMVQWVDDRIEAEQKLKEALREKEALINNTDDLIWSVDNEMRLVSFNQSYAEIVRQLAGLSIRKGMSGVMPEFGEEAANRWEEYYRRALNGESFSVLEENRQESGKFFSEVLLTPIRDGGSIVGASCIARDVTELQRSQEKLKAGTRRLQVAQRIAKLGDWSYEGEGTEIWSDETYAIFERDFERGPVPFRELLSKLLSPSDSQRLLSAVEKATGQGEPYDLELTLQLPFGKEKVIRVVGIPKRGKDGDYALHGIVQDITDRVVAEAKLHEQKAYWQMLTRHASDGIAVCDADGKLVFYNETMRSWQGEEDASLKQEEWAEAYGLYTLDGSRLLRPDEIELCRALKGETVTNFRHSVRIPGQPLRYVESSGGPIFDNDGNKIGAMVLVRDITDRYKREYEITDAVIEASEQERERIASELHDSVAQELSIVSLNLNNFQLENPPASESVRFLKAQAYLQRAIDDTRAISHRMVPGTVRDLGLVGAARELVEDLNESGSLELAFTCNFDDRLNHTQELDIFRIIQEALHNVMKHAEASLAAVDIQRKGEFLEISISDNGQGFAAAESHVKKVGIGIRAMRNRARKWGGTFQIQSDKGSTTVLAEIPIKEAP